MDDSDTVVLLSTILGFGASLGYFATSGTKFDVIFLVSDPDLLIRQQNFVCILRSYQDAIPR